MTTLEGDSPVEPNDSDLSPIEANDNGELSAEETGIISDDSHSPSPGSSSSLNSPNIESATTSTQSKKLGSSPSINTLLTTLDISQTSNGTDQANISYVNWEAAKEHGKSLFKAGDYGKSLEVFTIAIKMNRKSGSLSPVPYANRSAAYTRIGKLYDAIQDAKNCLQIDSHYAKGHIRACIPFLKIGHVLAAESAYESAIKLDPTLASDFISDSISQLKRSVPHFNSLIQKCRDIQLSILRNLKRQISKQKSTKTQKQKDIVISVPEQPDDYHKVLESSITAANIARASARFQHNLALCYMIQRLWSHALKILLQFYTEFPYCISCQTCILLGKCYWVLGDFDNTIKYLSIAQKFATSNEMAMLRASENADTEDESLPLTWGPAPMISHPSNPFSLSDFASTVPFVTKTIQRFTQVNALKLAANESLVKGRFEEAISLYSEAIVLNASYKDDLHPPCPILFANRSAAYQKMKNFPRSLQDAKNAVLLNPLYVKGLIRLANNEARLGMLPHSLANYNRARDIDPEYPNLRESILKVGFSIAGIPYTPSTVSNSGSPFSSQTTGTNHDINLETCSVPRAGTFHHIASDAHLRIASLLVATQFPKYLNVIQYSAKWCGPCKQITPHVQKMASSYSAGVIFFYVDVDLCPKSSARVRAVPSFQILMGGKVLKVFQGADLSVLMAFIQSKMPSKSL